MCSSLDAELRYCYLGAFPDELTKNALLNLTFCWVVVLTGVVGVVHGSMLVPAVRCRIIKIDRERLVNDMNVRDNSEVCLRGSISLRVAMYVDFKYI